MNSMVTLRILVLEDDDFDFQAFDRQLKCPGYRFVVVRAKTLREARFSLDMGKYDAVVTDMHVPDSYGLDTIRELRQYCDTIPLLVFTGSLLDNVEKDLVSEGAQDLIVKGESGGAALTRSVLYAIERQHVLNRLRSLYEEADSNAKPEEERELKPVLSGKIKATSSVEDISQRLKTPLTVIRDFTSILQNEFVGSINKEQDRLLCRMLSRADEMNMAIEYLLINLEWSEQLQKRRKDQPSVMSE